ncbi:MAG: cupin domain-containing protein [Acidimicrobiales bacterium]
MTAEVIGTVRTAARAEATGRDRDGLPVVPRCRAILPATATGWSELALGEWELIGSGFGDCHPHVEINYVLEGSLVVTCDGERVVAGVGDMVKVPAGRPAWYEAPKYARMLYIYGPNPDGRASLTFASAEGASRSLGLIEMP